MSTYVVPTDLSRRALEFLRCALQVVDETGSVWPTGDPPSAKTTMCRLMNKTPANVMRAFRELEAAGLGHRRIVARKGSPGAGGLRFIIHATGTPWVTGLCATCGVATNGTGRWCATHKQTEGRHDRRWQVAAEVLLEQGHHPLKIAALLQRPLLVASVDDGRSANGGAVVPYLLGRGLLGAEWAERLRNAAMGNEEA